MYKLFICYTRQPKLNIHTQPIKHTQLNPQEKKLNIHITWIIKIVFPYSIFQMPTTELHIILVVVLGVFSLAFALFLTFALSV